MTNWRVLARLRIIPEPDLLTFHTVAGARATSTKKTPTPTSCSRRYSSAIRCLR
ncbi:MAG TPA: hypothetical protein VFD59_07065 [Nocardioidaceae bacterium]|nr:hypothetical protein [Nocardioidaceae bacterium]